MTTSPPLKKNFGVVPDDSDRAHAELAPRPSTSSPQPSTSNSATSSNGPSPRTARHSVDPIHNPFAIVTPSGVTRVRDPPTPWFYGGSENQPDAEAQARRQARLARHQRKKSDDKGEKKKRHTTSTTTTTNKNKDKQTQTREAERAVAFGGIDLTLVTLSGGAGPSTGTGPDAGPGRGFLRRVGIRARPSFADLREAAKEHRERRE